MKKVSVSLPQGDWGTLKTKYPRNSDKVKFTEFTGTSKNFDTDISGVITKAAGGINYNPSLLSSAPQDLYEAIFSDGTHHMLTMNAGTLSYSAGGGILNTVTAGYSSIGNMEFALYQNRVYFGNGIDNPQSYDTATSYGGVGYTGPKTKQMGALVPSSAPTAALVVDSTTAQVPAGAHTYKVTYLYYGAQESNGSTASTVVTADATHTQVTVTIPVGGYGVTARKVYRDNSDGNFLLVGSVLDNTSTTFADKASTGTTAIPTDNGLPPTFAKIIQHLDRLWCAGVSASTSTLYYSQAGLPDLFAATGYILCNPKDPIVAMVVYNNRIVVLNRNSIGQITGRDSTTFAYAEIPSSIGCCDNRSVQIRTSKGVPTLLWLSDKGFYQFNGSSIDYVSDDIEDQVNFNIQQAAQVKGKNAQDTQTDFQGGTSTAGISLTVGGLITQANPKKVYQLEADWATGTSTNVAQISTGNVIQSPILNAYDIASGSFNSCIQSGSTIVLPLSGSYTGETVSGSSYSPFSINSPSHNSGVNQVASPFIPRASGTLSSFSCSVSTSYHTAGHVLYFKVWADTGTAPGSEIYSVATAAPFDPNVSNSVQWNFSLSPSFHMNNGTRYWIGMQTDDGVTRISNVVLGSSAWSGGSRSKVNFNSGAWEDMENIGSTGPIGDMAAIVGFTQDPISNSGQWTSSTFDSKSTSTAPVSVSQSGSYPSGCSSIVYVEGSADGTTWDVSTAVNSINGGSAITPGSNRRYWRVRSVLISTDNRLTPTLGSATILFPTTSTWISAAIDHTTDITLLNSLTTASNVPTNTSVTVTIATSADNITYSGYTAIGSAVPNRYSKIKVVMTTDAGNTITPSVSNIQLNWTVVSTQTSSAIDTSNTPVGWELFQSSYLTSGTVTFQVRTATTSGGLSGAGWVTVTNGSYIAAAVNRWIQWKATLTSTADNIAVVDNVTINWFIKLVNSIRVASLFYNRAYFVAAAEFGQTTNNIVFKLDERDCWRVYRGVSIGTLSFFFNEPYYGSSTTGQIVKWLTSTTNAGTNISMDVQTAAINYEDLEHNKILRKVRIIGKNTGATYTPQYSVDNGLTWKSMVNPLTGLTTFTTASDGGLFDIRVQPTFATDNATGITHIFRMLNSDALPCEIHNIKIEAWIRQGEI